MQTGMKAGGRPAGLGWNLVGSAAAHFLALACGLLLLRATTAQPPAGVVEVDLVGGSFAAVSAEGKHPFRLIPDRVNTVSSREDDRMAHASGGSPREEPQAEPERGIPGGEALSGIGGDIRNGIYGTTGLPAVNEMGPAKETTVSVPVETRGRAEIAGPGKPFTALLPSADGGGGRGGEGDVRLLRDRIESRIVYPEDAVRRGQEGVVLLRVRIGEGGIPKEIRIARSSGLRVLDEAARSGVVRAAPLPSTPGWFEVPVRFHLR